MSAQIPGFIWSPSDSDHFSRGRGGSKIRLFIQHYSAGTYSLPHLTTTSDPPVSAHFLIKHHPTMADRGWQMVRLQDTAWAARSANPFAVSVEYEHDGSQPIPDIAYQVMAQTWLDIRDEVKRLGLGDVGINRQEIVGHGEAPGNSTHCPDGVQVDWIVETMRSIVGGAETGVPTGAPPMPQTVPDPWGTKFWIPKPFVDEIRSHDWMMTGYCVSPAVEKDDKIVQFFERARLEIQPDGSITRGLVGAELMRLLYPELG